MYYFLETGLLPAVVFEKTCNVTNFKNWLKKTHNVDYDEKILIGHRFFLECAFTSIFYEFISSDSIPLKMDRVLGMATNSSCTIDKIQSKSDRVLILKNLYKDYIALTKAGDELNLENAIKSIRTKVTTRFSKFYSTNFRVNKKIKLSKKDVDYLTLTDNILTYYIQINNSGPYAHHGALLPEYWIPKDKLNESFEGYKYTIQYLFESVLPSDVFIQAQIDKIHTAENWQTYIYNEQEKDDDDIVALMNRTFDIEKQTCFENYFHRLHNVLNEKIPPLYGISYTDCGRNLVPIKKKLPFQVIKHLIDPSIERFDIKMSLEEQLDYYFLWERIDITNVLIDKRFNGVAAFNTLLLGTLSATKQDFVYVNKFKHTTIDPKQSYYSYAVLLNTLDTANHGDTGWMLFLDCCNDYTGSRTQFLSAEDIIKKNKKRIKLVQYEIRLEELSGYLKNHMPDKSHLEHNDFLKDMSKLKENKTLFEKYQSARGVLLELLCYYVITMHHHYEGFSIKRWGRKLGGKEIDVLLESKTQVRLIECKYNGQGRDLDISKRIIELNTVINERIQNKKSEKKGVETFDNKIDGAIEFWFWLPPSKQDIELLTNKGIKFEIFTGGKKSEYENLIKFTKMKSIFDLNNEWITE